MSEKDSHPSYHHISQEKLFGSSKVIHSQQDIQIIHFTTLITLKVLYQVSCLVSPVLHGILAYNFLNTSVILAEIVLAISSPAAFEVVFNILHFQHDYHSYYMRISCDLLYQIAKFANILSLLDMRPMARYLDQQLGYCWK